MTEEMSTCMESTRPEPSKHRAGATGSGSRYGGERLPLEKRLMKRGVGD